MRKQICDGSWVNWAAEWVDHECGECGQVTGKHDAAEPDFHGKCEWRDHNADGRGSDLVCTRCGCRQIG